MGERETPFELGLSSKEPTRWPSFDGTRSYMNEHQRAAGVREVSILRRSKRGQFWVQIGLEKEMFFLLENGMGGISISSAVWYRAIEAVRVLW